MPIDSKLVGSNERQVIIIGDQSSASKYASVLAPADAMNLAGLYAALGLQVPLLLNSGGTFDQLRSAIGTTGILAVSNESAKATYSVGTTGFTPVATATDFVEILGSATKTVRLLRVTITGFATAAISVSVTLVKRTTANTGGTKAALTIGSHDSNDGAATAVVSTYSVNPTLGTSGGIVRAAKLNLGATGAAGSIVWDFSNRNSKAMVLRGVAQQFSLNWGGAAIPGGTVLDFDFEFSEE